MNNGISNGVGEFRNLNRAGVKKLAIDLAKKNKNQDTLIGLVGPLGAGKTTFVKDFASFYKIRKIKSPTFVIGHTHPTQKSVLHHYDFYRLDDRKQLNPLGFNEIISSKNRIVLIEWADKFPEIMKKCDTIISFRIAGKNLRNVTIKIPNDK